MRTEFGLAPTRPTSLIDRATDGTITPLAVGYTICSTLAFAVQYWTTRRHMHRRPFASGPAT